MTGYGVSHARSARWKGAAQPRISVAGFPAGQVRRLRQRSVTSATASGVTLRDVTADGGGNTW